jgi:hypothetical protein
MCELFRRVATIEFRQVVHGLQRLALLRVISSQFRAFRGSKTPRCVPIKIRQVNRIQRSKSDHETHEEMQKPITRNEAEQ